MRIATFNLESLDLPPKAALSIEARATVLRPALARLDADVICLQEVNAQHVRGREGRALLALDRLLETTPLAHYHRAATSAPQGKGLADVHNLVTLTRTAPSAVREIRHDFVPPPVHALRTAVPQPTEPATLRFDRPLLLTEIPLGDGRRLTIVNLHLRAPLASSIPGQKQGAFKWKSIGGWAEGFYVSAVRRDAQALELRLLIDELLGQDPQRLIAVAGDFNAEDHDTPLKIVIGAEEDTGNGLLASHSLAVLDRALPADRRWSVLHHGRPQMLDHILASRSLLAHVRAIEVHNETLGDEAIGYAKVHKPPGSYHAAVVATFDLPAAPA